MPDSVHIMTIHKSKGLEFPVVFLADARKEFNLRDTWQTAICHKDLGLGIQYYDKRTESAGPACTGMPSGKRPAGKTWPRKPAFSTWP